jgi:5-methylthioribose kinase
MLAGMIRLGWRNPEFERTFGDQTVFDQLRLDPYYRSTAARHPDLRPHFDRLIEECGGFRLTLVHGDWSPKNFLVDGSAAMAIDFEVIHYGDPAFDAAFLLNHLLLKSFHLPGFASEFAVLADVFWRTLLDGFPAEAAGFEERTIRHLGGLLLARIDGKSPAEYIRDAGARDEIRSFARRLILNPPPTVQESFRRLER